MAGIKTSGGFGISYVLSNSKSLSFEYMGFKDWSAEYADDYSEFVNLIYIKQNSFGLVYKKFFRNSIAPLGGYLRITAAYTRNYFADNIEFNDFEVKPGIKFGFGIGKHRVFFDKIIINYGILGYFNFVKSDSDLLYLDFLDNSNESSRILMRDLLQIHLGVGYLF